MFAAAAFFLLLGVFLRTVMPKPHVWVFAFLSWAAACGFSAGAARPLAAKYGWLVIMSVFLALFAAEGWLSLGATGVMPAYVKADIDEVRKERGDATLAPYMSNIEKYDPVLGARPRAAASRTASRFYRDGRMLYDVVYSTLDSGWRVTPQNPDADKAVVFFGCSFTFGQGLEDEQTIPWRVAELLGPEYQVFNFALYGYGAHQMLAQIENGFVDDIARRYQDVQAFFLTIDGHELRCSGFEEWVKSGPLYAEENGRVVYKGDIRNMDRPSLPPLRKMLRNCLVFQSIVGSTPPQSREMRELHAAIVAESARQMREKYHAPLTVLLWPDAPFEGQLRGRGLDPVSLVPALPDWETARSGYYIPYDGHPNALGADHVARFIAARVQKRAAAQAPESE
jgi:hypothetical protein